MPELPEVETVRRGLLPVMEGNVIALAEVRRSGLRWPFPADMAETLTGARVLHLRRRSKYILADLDRGQTALIHLGMSGRILISGQNGTERLGDFHFEHPPLDRHDHVIFHMASGARVTFNDPRRFGAMDICPSDRLDEHPLLASLGPEPLGNSFNDTYLATRLRGRKAPIKAALLDQRIISGLGNIYVCEALFRAGIHPRRAAGRISQGRISALVDAIRATLEDAIGAGGSSLRDYRQTNGELGYFQHSFHVYGREGASCRAAGCMGHVQRIVQSGRSSFYCPRCQR